MNTVKSSEKGFTFIELIVVVSIIAILAAIAIPQFSLYRARAHKAEAYSLLPEVFSSVTNFYSHTGYFPKNNSEAGLPQSDYLKGKSVESITVSGDTVTVIFNKKIIRNYGSDKDLTKGMLFKATFTDSSSMSPIVWTAGKI